MLSEKQFENIEIETEDGFCQRVGIDKVQFVNVLTGASGWFDDGANFRITCVNGLITVIGDSTGGGHS